MGLVASLSLVAGELPTGLQAKFIKVIAASASSGTIACRDAALASELKGLGIGVEGGAKLAYAGSEGDLAALKGKLIVVPKLEWLAKGGAIALIEEGGKPAIYLHMGHIAASGVTLSDAILKIGKKI
jgi:hypothetical protein